MNKKLFNIAIVLFTLLLTSCNQLSQYTIDEQQLNSYLKKYETYQTEIGLPGLANANIAVTSLTSQIGRKVPNMITLDAQTKINLMSIIGQQDVSLNLTLMAQPIYDHQQGAIYLKDLMLSTYQVQPEKIDTVIKALLPYLTQSLNDYFKKKPVYTLDPDKNKTEMLARKLAKDIEVKPGQIVIPFTE